MTNGTGDFVVTVATGGWGGRSRKEEIGRAPTFEAAKGIADEWCEREWAGLDGYEMSRWVQLPGGWSRDNWVCTVWVAAPSPEDQRDG